MTRGNFGLGLDVVFHVRLPGPTAPLFTETNPHQNSCACCTSSPDSTPSLAYGYSHASPLSPRHSPRHSPLRFRRSMTVAPFGECSDPMRRYRFKSVSKIHFFLPPRPSTKTFPDAPWVHTCPCFFRVFQNELLMRTGSVVSTRVGSASGFLG